MTTPTTTTALDHAAKAQADIIKTRAHLAVLTGIRNGHLADARVKGYSVSQIAAVLVDDTGKPMSHTRANNLCKEALEATGKTAGEKPRKARPTKAASKSAAKAPAKKTTAKAPAKPKAKAPVKRTTKATAAKPRPGSNEAVKAAQAARAMKAEAVRKAS